MILGNLEPRVVEVAVRSSGDIRCNLGHSVTNSEKVEAFIIVNQDDSIEEAIIEKSSIDGEIQVLSGESEIYIRLDDADRALLNPSRVYHLYVNVLDIDTQGILSIDSFHLLPIEQFINAQLVMPILSTRFVNSQQLAGAIGGPGYLDGLPTLTQPVGCQISFVVDGVRNIYILEVWTDQGGEGFVEPSDFDPTSNPKIWRQI